MVPAGHLAVRLGEREPDRVVLHVAALPGQKPPKTESWYAQHITAVIANIRAKYPAVQRIDLMPIVGGPQHQVCSISVNGQTNQVWASVSHPVVDGAIEDLIGGDVFEDWCG